MGSDSADLIKIVTEVGGGIGVLWIAYRILQLLRNGKNGNGNGKKAGELDPAFWQLEYRKILAEILVPALDRQEQILSGLRDTNMNIRDALMEIKGVVERLK